MSAFFYSNTIVKDFSSFKNLERTGPDQKDTFYSDNETFYQTRLIDTSNKLTTNVIKCLLDGSTYNYQNDLNYTNQVDWFVDNIDTQANNNIELIKDLNGEFGICIVSNDNVIFAVDCFGSRSLYYYYNESEKIISIASLPDCIEQIYGHVWPCEINTVYVLDKNTFKIKIITLTEWNFEQKINNYDTVFDCFEKSVCKRYNQDALILLSAGWDSGAIACAANRHFKNIDAVGIVGNENYDVLISRASIHNLSFIVDDIVSDEKIENLYNISNNFNIKRFPLATSRLLNFCDYASKIKKKIILTGEGGDAIYGDSGSKGHRIRPYSKFGGVWHSDLKLLWPWYTNNGGFPTMLARTNVILGYSSKEMRVPFADKELVQSWLNTTLNLKNNSFKDWIYQYLYLNNYPIDEISKTGLTGDWSNIV